MFAVRRRDLSQTHSYLSWHFDNICLTPQVAHASSIYLARFIECTAVAVRTSQIWGFWHGAHKLCYKPPKVIINNDPHFAEFHPSFKSGEVRQILIGGRTTLKTGYQYNLANITPLGLYAAIDLAPKRQGNLEDLGDLHYADTFGKAAERVQQAGISLAGFQADRGLQDAALFAVSQQHAWPTAAGDMGSLADFTRGSFLVTPWTATHMTKAYLITSETFVEIQVMASNLLGSQYAGNQSFVQAVLGPDPKCKVPVETAVVTLRKVGGAWAFLRVFQVFEVDADAPALALLKGQACRNQAQLASMLKTCCKAYNSRWCIESGYQTIDYHFPLRFRGNSSDTHLRIYVVQGIVFNSYRVAQIKHVGATKPANWHPWEPKEKFRCRRFSAADLRGFSSKTYLLGLLKESMMEYFCRSSS